jgi:hypothetical protein
MGSVISARIYIEFFVSIDYQDFTWISNEELHQYQRSRIAGGAKCSESSSILAL